ncbi:MAG: tetratricopeptide repeat protein [bacterium]|nr:tetratricopeptide repeat protein [bacterium]
MSQRKIKKLKKQNQEILQKSNVSSLIGIEIGFVQALKKYWKFLTVLLILAIVVFANGLAGNFVSDDYATITQFPQLGDFWFMMNKDSFANSMYLTNHLVFKLFGNTSPVPYHFLSLVIYLLVLVIGFVFVLTIFGDSTLAMVSMLLFAVMPIHVEAVSWISGRLYMILAGYIMLSMLNIIYYFKSGKFKYLGFSFLFFVLAFQTDKPRPFALFFILFIYLLYVGFDKLKHTLSRIWWIIPIVIVVFALLSVSYANMRINVVNSGTNSSGTIFYDPLFQYPTSIAKYLQLLWFPVDLTLYHTMYVFPNWLNWAIFLTYLTMMIYFYFKNKKYFFVLAFIFAATAPSMAPVKVSWLVAERYIFLGSLGFAVFLGMIMLDISKYFKLIPAVIFVSFMIIFSVRSFTRNIDWSTNHELWVNTCQVSPNSHNAWNNIGDDYDKLKQYENAIKGFTQSTIVKPNYADAYHNRANIFYKVGRLDLARESYDTALKFNPGMYQTYMSLIQIDLNEKNFDLALAHANILLQVNPGDPQSQYVVGVVYAQAGQLAKAREILKSVLIQYPDYVLARNALLEIDKLPPANK